MQKFKKQIEAQIQEIVFFSSLLLAFSTFLSGVFYLALTPESVSYILGGFGSTVVQMLIGVFGFGFFYLVVMALHMGYVTNMHVFLLKDFKREYQVLSISVVAHVILLTMLATLISVIQIYFEMPHGEVLNRGAGGLLGFAFGQVLYSNLGVLGSIFLLLGVAFGTSLFADFFELKDVLEAIKDGALSAKDHTVHAARKLNEAAVHSLQQLIKGRQLATAHASPARSSASKNLKNHSKNLMNHMNKANDFFTEHIHANKEKLTNLIKRNTVKAEKTVDKTEKKVKKAVVRTKTIAKAKKTLKTLKIENPLKALTDKKTKKKVVATKKSSKTSEASKR